MGFFNGEPLESQGTFISRILIQLIIILVLPRILHFTVLQRLWQPRVVSEILSGIILGPSVLGIIPGFTDNIFPSRSLPYLNSLAQIGLILFLFMVGLGLDVEKIWESRKITFLSVILGLGMPLCIAPSVSFAFLKSEYTNADFQELLLLISLLLYITALAVLARILADRKLLVSTLGSVTMSTTAVDTLLSWILLAIILSLYGSRVPWVAPATTCPGQVYISPNDSNSSLDPLYIVLCYLGLVLVIVIPIRFIFKQIAKRVEDKGRMEVWVFWFSIVVCFAISWVTQTLTLSGMFGAFTFGLVGVPRIGTICSEIRRTLDGLVVTVLLPVFFAYSGLRTDWKLLDGGAIARAFLLLFSMYFTKLIGVYFSAFIFGMRGFKGIYYGLLLTVKGLTALAMLNICLDTGIITDKMFALCVFYSVIATIIPSPVIRFVQIFDHWCKRGRKPVHDEMEHILVIPRASHLGAAVMSIGSWIAAMNVNSTVTAARIISDTDEEFLEFHKLSHDDALAFDPILGICNNRWIGMKNKSNLKLRAILAPNIIDDMKLFVSGEEDDSGVLQQPTDYLVMGYDHTNQTNHLITSLSHLENLKMAVYIGRPGSDIVISSRILLIRGTHSPADNQEALNLALAIIKDNTKANLSVWSPGREEELKADNVDSPVIINDDFIIPETVNVTYVNDISESSDILELLERHARDDLREYDIIISPLHFGHDLSHSLEKLAHSDTPIILVKSSVEV